MNLDPADELAVRALVARYADAVNLADAEMWGNTWAETGEWHIMGRDIAGRETILEFWRSAMSSFESVIQLVAQGRVQGEADGAVGRWTIWEIGRRAGGGTLTVGCYEDRYAKEAEEWRFAARRFTATYRGEIAAGEFFPFPGAG